MQAGGSCLEVGTKEIGEEANENEANSSERHCKGLPREVTFGSSELSGNIKSPDSFLLKFRHS